MHLLLNSFHECQHDDPAQAQQGKQRRQHIHLPADVAPLGTHETATGKRVGRHEHEAVVHIAHDTLAVKVAAPHQIANRRYHQHDTQHTAHLHPVTHRHSLLILSLLHIFIAIKFINKFQLARQKTMKIGSTTPHFQCKIR